jgi:hypothetical protein
MPEEIRRELVAQVKTRHRRDMVNEAPNAAISAGGTFLRIATYDTQTKNTAGDLGNSPKDRARAA